jgi:hypothetical protein
MILKVKIQNNKIKKKNKRITVWIQKKKEFGEDLKQLFQFFKENIQVTKQIRLHKYYKITSENPAILLSLVSTINELIPEIYFSSENPIEKTEMLNIENV